MSKYPKDLCGERFGRLVAVKPVVEPEGLKDIKAKRGHFWLCICDCGREKIANRYSLTTKSGTKSCGCLTSEANSSRKGTKYKKVNNKNRENKKEKGIPKNKTRIYRIWNAMRYRCLNPNSPSYKNYGERGIKICDRWMEFESFKEDMYDSFLQFEKEHGEGTATFDRIDVNGNYDPENCRWVTTYEQSRNKRNSIKTVVCGKRYESLVDLAKEYNIDVSTVRYRYKIGKRGIALIESI